MSWVSDIFSSAVGEVVDSVGEAIDRNWTTDHEAMQEDNRRAELDGQIRIAVEKIMADKEAKVIEAAQAEQQELTKRLMIDNKSDSPLARNVRPAAYLVMIVSVLLMAAFTLDPQTIAPDQKLDTTALTAWIDLFTTLLVAMTAFYFGSRGLEKIADKVSRYFGRDKA